MFATANDKGNLLSLLEVHYAARLRRGRTREELEADIVRQLKAEAPNENWPKDPTDFAKKILDAAEDLNKRLVW